jgi:hypothetical protein
MSELQIRKPEAGRNGVLKTGNRALVLLFGGIFVLLSCVIVPVSLTEKGILLNGDCGLNKAVVTAEKQPDPQGTSGLTPREVKRLADTLGTEEFTYTARPALFRAPVKAGDASAVSYVIGANHMLPRFLRMELIRGSFFTETAEREGANVAVIDDRLAWKVFKSFDAAGKTLEIYGVKFKVIGVVRKDASVLGSLADDGFPEVFIPGARLFELDAGAAILSFQVRTEDTGTMDNNRIRIAGALQETGRDPSAYRIEDYNIKRALLEQKPDILMFILGSIVILILLSWLKDVVKEAIAALRLECGTDYLTNVLRRNGGRTGIAALKALSAAAAIFIVGAAIRFRLFIPPERIPEELIDVSFYSELIRNGIRGAIESGTYGMDAAGLLLRGIGMFTGWPLIIMAAAGFLLAYAGLARLGALDIEMPRLSLACGLFMLISLIALAAAAGASGLPLGLKTRNILVVWAFIYTNILRCYLNGKGKCWYV